MAFRSRNGEEAEGREIRGGDQNGERLGQKGGEQGGRDTTGRGIAKQPEERSFAADHQGSVSEGLELHLHPSAPPVPPLYK